jgi:hypothetical protein
VSDDFEEFMQLLKTPSDYQVYTTDVMMSFAVWQELKAIKKLLQRIDSSLDTLVEGGNT